jgi:hypothetical protein
MAVQTWSKRFWVTAVSVLLAGPVVFISARAKPAHTGNPVAAQNADDAAVLKDFQDRAQKYLETHKVARVRSTNSPDKLNERKQQAAEKVRESRPAARQGDIFTPQISAYFKKQLTVTLQGPDGPKVRASLRHAEPLPKVRLRVNDRYPRNLPLQSTPPTLLLNLPRLPGKLQYRIVGPTLVLYDSASALIVDFIPNAIPAS